MNVNHILIDIGTGSIPSARAAHGAACVGKNSIVIYGGATKQGLASD